jgi:hypothetical protein
VLNQSYCYSPLGDKIDFGELKKNTIIKTSDYFATVESLIRVNDEIVYEIKTEFETLKMPENSMIKTDQGFLPVYSLDKHTTLFYNDSLVNIKSLKIIPPTECLLIDTYEDSDYSYDGFYIKNPLFIKSFSKQFLSPLNISSNTTQTLIIDGIDYHAVFSDGYYMLEKINLDALTVHTILFSNESLRAVIFYKSGADITVKNNNRTNVVKDGKSYVCNFENNHIVEIKSNSNIEIVKIIVK